MNKDIIVKEMYWDNIYLCVTFEGSSLDDYKFYISDLRRDIYSIEVYEGKSRINIVNIEKTKLLNNGKWYFLAEKKGDYQLIGIQSACGYELEKLDKVYRYGKDIYAYVVTFSVEDSRDLFEKMQKNQNINYKFSDINRDKMLCVIHT